MTVLILIPTVSYGQQQSQSDIKYEKYVSNSGHFSMDYPGNWTLREKNRFDPPEYPNLTISNGELGTARWHLYFLRWNTSLPELMRNIFERDAKLAEFKPNVVEPINLTRYTVDGEEAGTYIYSARLGNILGSEVPIGSQTIATTHNGMVYSFTFVAPGDKFDSPEVTEIKEHMIKSIKWLP